MKNLEQQFVSDVDAGRRRLLAGLIGLPVLLASRSTAAEVLGAVLCEEEKGTGSLTDKACNGQEIDPHERGNFILSMRSASAFKELALKLLLKGMSFPDRRFSMLYPGSADHIAVAMIPAQLMDAGVIDEAEMIFTEVKNEFPSILSNLQNLSKLNPDFKVEPGESALSCGKGQEMVLNISYKGKPIRLRFLLNCSSGNWWFRPEDLAHSDVFVSHDPEKTSTHIIGLLAQFFWAKKKNLQKRTAIIMEDLSRSSDQPGHTGLGRDGELMKLPYEREFDLELIGTYLGGTKPYGHRGIQRIPGTVSNCNCDKQHEVSGEAGVPDDLAGCVFEFYPEIFKLTERGFGLLADIDILAKNPSGIAWGLYAGSSRERIFNDHELVSSSMLSDVLEHGGKLMDFMRKINPDLSRGLACRILQCLVAFTGRYNDSYWQSILKEGGPERVFGAAKNLFASVEKVLTPEDLQHVGVSIAFLKNLFRQMEDIYPVYFKRVSDAEKLRDKMCVHDDDLGRCEVPDSQWGAVFRMFDRANDFWEKKATAACHEYSVSGGDDVISAEPDEVEECENDRHWEVLNAYGDKIFDSVRMRLMMNL